MRTQIWDATPVHGGPPSGPRPPWALPCQHHLEGQGLSGRGESQDTPSVSSPLFPESETSPPFELIGITGNPSLGTGEGAFRGQGRP